MSHSLNCLLIDPHQRTELVFALAHHRSGPLEVLVAEPMQKQFFEDVLLNINCPNITFSTFQEYTTSHQTAKESVIVIDIPHTFQIMNSLLQAAQKYGHTFYLLLLKSNKKYLKMLQKKTQVSSTILDFSSNKFVGINDKLRSLVEQSYDINRAAFYAYGAYLNYFRGNLLKKIFRSDQIDVTKLASSFGFTTPPRVKEGKFLSIQAQKQKKLNSKKLKTKKREQPQKQQKVIKKVPQVETQTKVVKVVKSSKKKIIKKRTQ